MEPAHLRTQIYQSLLDLATEEGINASGKDEIYGCIFGRDSAVTILKILKVLSHPAAKTYVDANHLQDMCRKALITLSGLQGKNFNIESGEEPGKFIHEYRKDRYEHLVNLEKPWFVYPDGKLRNYDSIDSTPLSLIAMYRYWQLTNDAAFLLQVLPSVEAGLNWILKYADQDRDHLLEYELPATRKYGGLPVQSWTDSHESLLQSDNTMPLYPIAPVEVQGYAWLALNIWSEFFALHDDIRKQAFAKTLHAEAGAMKNAFNASFLFQDGEYSFTAQALDGKKKQIRTITGNPLLLLWAAYENNGTNECILERRYVQDVVNRSFQSDLFEEDAGIRTMSRLAPAYNPGQDCYHNGSFWPKLNGMAHEGLEKMGFIHEANRLKIASLKPIIFFGTPIELYVKSKDGLYLEFNNGRGQTGCREQAWSAAATLDLLIP